MNAKRPWLRRPSNCCAQDATIAASCEHWRPLRGGCWAGAPGSLAVSIVSRHRVAKAPLRCTQPGPFRGCPVTPPFRRSGACTGSRSPPCGSSCSARPRPVPRAARRQVHVQHLANGGGRAVGHHHDLVGQQHGLVHVVRHHHHGALRARHDLQQLVLQLGAGQASARRRARPSAAPGFHRQRRAMPALLHAAEISLGALLSACVRPTRQGGVGAAP